MNIMDFVSKKTHVTNTDSINCHSIKLIDCYILHTILLAVILLLIIVIFCYHYSKKVWFKIENNNLKKKLY